MTSHPVDGDAVPMKRLTQRGPVRVAVFDEATEIRIELEGVVAREPDLLLVGCADAELWPLVSRCRPEVVVLDVAYGALELWLDIKRQPNSPAAVLYTSSRRDDVSVAAALAGVGLVIGKSSPAADLLQAIRTLAAYPRVVPPISAQLRREAAARLDPADHPIIAMRLAGESATEIGKTLGVPPDAIERRIAKMLARLEPIASAG